MAQDAEQADPDDCPQKRVERAEDKARGHEEIARSHERAAHAGGKAGLHERTAAQHRQAAHQARLDKQAAHEQENGATRQ